MIQTAHPGEFTGEEITQCQEYISSFDTAFEKILQKGNRIQTVIPFHLRNFFETDTESFLGENTRQHTHNEPFIGQSVMRDSSEYRSLKNEFVQGIEWMQKSWGVRDQHTRVYDSLRKNFHSMFVSSFYKAEEVNAVARLLGSTTVHVRERTLFGDRDFRNVFARPGEEMLSIQKKLYISFYRMHIAKHFFGFIEQQISLVSKK